MSLNNSRVYSKKSPGSSSSIASRLKKFPKRLNEDYEDEYVDVNPTVDPFGGVICGSHTMFANSFNRNEILYRLFLDVIDSSSVKLHGVFNALSQASGSDLLEIRINSEGGYIRYGLPIINLMRNVFYGRTRTIVDIEAYSMGAFIFLSGYERLIYPNALLMLHEISYSFGGKSSKNTEYALMQSAYNKNLLDDLAGSFLSEKEVNDILNGKDIYYNAKGMCENGMAHGVIVAGNTVLSADDYLLYLENPAVLAYRDGEFVLDEELVKKMKSDRKSLPKKTGRSSVRKPKKEKTS